MGEDTAHAGPLSHRSRGLASPFPGTRSESNMAQGSRDHTPTGLGCSRSPSPPQHPLGPTLPCNAFPMTLTLTALACSPRHCPGFPPHPHPPAPSCTVRLLPLSPSVICAPPPPVLQRHVCCSLPTTAASPSGVAPAVPTHCPRLPLHLALAAAPHTFLAPPVRPWGAWVRHWTRGPGHPCPSSSVFPLLCPPPFASPNPFQLHRGRTPVRITCLLHPGPPSCVPQDHC